MSTRSGSKETGQLYFLVGPPLAGKSTWGNTWLRKKGPRPKAVLAGDDFRLALHGCEWSRFAEGFIVASIDVAARALLGRGHDVLIDETSTSEESIKRYFRIHPNPQPIFLDVSLEELYRRAETADRQYLKPVIERTFAQKQQLEANWPALREQFQREISCENSVLLLNSGEYYH